MKSAHALADVETLPPRLLDREAAAAYLSVSAATLDRLIQSGALAVIRLPVERGRTGLGVPGRTRRILLDVRDLDALIERSRERS